MSQIDRSQRDNRRKHVYESDIMMIKRRCRAILNTMSRKSLCTMSNTTKELLVVYHSRTGLAKSMTESLIDGANQVSKEMGEKLEIRRKKARDCSIDDIMSADGYIFCAPENLATLSGEMLEFFHRNYYHVFRTNLESEGGEYHEESQILGRPYGVAIAAGSDGMGAVRHVTRICTGWRLKSVGEPLVVNNGLPQTKANILSPKILSKESKMQCHEVGGLVAATLLL